jgi:hypothetical protein
MRMVLLLASLAIALGWCTQGRAAVGDAGKPDSIPTFEKTGVQPRERIEDLRFRTLAGKPYQLSEAWKDRPALLVLSSISCPVSRDNCAAVDRLAKTYAGKINVVVIYTIEAHPVGSASPYSDKEWLTPRNIRDQVLVKQPATIEDRIAIAKQYKALQRIESTLVVDAMDDAAWRHLGPAPNTGILVDRDGKV